MGDRFLNHQNKQKPIQHMIIFISTDGKRIAVTVKGSSSLLRISSTEMSDIGVYSCNHDNYRVTMVINATMAVYNKGMNGHRYVLVTHFKSKVSGRETFIYLYILPLFSGRWRCLSVISRCTRYSVANRHSRKIRSCGLSKRQRR